MRTVEFSVNCFDEWMAVRFGGPMHCLSWAVVNGGSTKTDTVAWRFLEKDELRDAGDPAAYLRSRMEGAGLSHAVGLMTSRRRHAWVESSHERDGVACAVVATVGLSNALAAGDPPCSADASTINLLCTVSISLSEEAALEALALASEARAAAMMASGARSRATGEPATGTGTDCIVIASPASGEPACYAGKHTALGHVIGAAARGAIAQGIEDWIQEFR
jgi:adenosylcobinamide amidohydrolase